MVIICVTSPFNTMEHENFALSEIDDNFPDH